MKLLTRSEAFVLPIRKQSSGITGYGWSLGSLCTPLERLVEKGLFTSCLTVSTAEQGMGVTRLALEGGG